MVVWKAFGRRFLIYSGTAILTYIIANWQAWFTNIAKDYPNIVALQGTLFLFVELAQKWLRERAKA